MKKKALLGLILAMTLCLSGCGNLLQNVTDGTEKNSEEVATDIAGDSNEDAEASNSYLEVEFERHYDGLYEEIQLMYGHYETVILHNTEYPALADAVGLLNTEKNYDSQIYFEELKTSAQEDYKAYGAEYFSKYIYRSDMHALRADSQVLSLVETCYDYAGGAHGFDYYNVTNFDVATGEKIALEDIVKDMNTLPAALETAFTEKYPDVESWMPSLKEAFESYIEPADPNYAPVFTWGLGYEGITFYFSSGEIAGYTEGTFQVTLSLSEYGDLFETDYFANTDKNYVLYIPEDYVGLDTDLNDDGATDYVSIRNAYSEDMEYITGYELVVNDCSLALENYCMEYDAYLVKTEDKNLVYVQRHMENGYGMIDVFSVTEDTVELVGEHGGTLTCFSNSKHFYVSKIFHLLSTYSATSEYCVGEDGLPATITGLYEVEGELSLVSTVEITAELVNEEGYTTGENKTFPAGTTFTFQCTDGESYVDVVTQDGVCCRFFTQEEWPTTVNGMDATTSFETLWFAG